MPLLPLVLALTTGQAHATEIGARPFGLGLVIGDPTGLSAKYYLGGRQNAIDVALAFDTIDDEGAYLHVTYLWHPSVLADDANFELPWHVGVGGYVVSDRWRNDEDAIGVRLPIGIDFDLHQVPLQFFVEAALHMDLVPETQADFTVGIGGRYYF